MSFAAWSAIFMTLIGAMSEQYLVQSLLKIRAKVGTKNLILKVNIYFSTS